jgi:hypothetical protein
MASYNEDDTDLTKSLVASEEKTHLEVKNDDIGINSNIDQIINEDTPKITNDRIDNSITSNESSKIADLLVLANESNVNDAQANVSNIKEENSQSILTSSFINTSDSILNSSIADSSKNKTNESKKRDLSDDNTKNNNLDIDNKKRQRKCYFDLSEIQKARNRRELRVHYRNLAACAESMGLSIDNINFIKNEGKPRDYVNCLTPKVFQEKKFSQKVDMAFKTLKAKDLCNMSYKKFTLFKNSLGLERIIPANNTCDKVKEKLNKFFEIEESFDGIYLKDPIKKIQLVCENYYKLNNRKIQNGKIMLKIACDGTNLTTKNMKQLNITFTLINDQKNAMSAKGNFILGMYKIQKECYETMKAPMKKVFDKLEQIKFINIGAKVYPVEHFSGGDMKSLALLYGINSANSIQPCVWCQWVRTSKFDINQTWPNRTLEDAKANVGRNGYINEPLTYIDFDHCPVDMLHLLIR